MTNEFARNQNAETIADQIPSSIFSKWLKEDFAQTKKEEITNTIIHSIGLLLGLVGLVIIWLKVYGTNNLLMIISGLVFAACIIVTYLASVLYHSCNNPKHKEIYRLFDHLTIYLMIAGSYTPFTLVTLHGTWGWILFISIWSLTILGTCFKTLFINTFENLSQAIYLLMGWLGICAVKPLLLLLAFKGFIWLLAGGLLYTLGVFFYRQEQFYYSHAVWHVFVLAGTFCHFMSIYFYVIS